MTAPLEIVQELYAKLTAGDASGALALMSDDIEWITMMDYKVDGRGPQKVLEGMLLPAMREWEPYTLTHHTNSSATAARSCRWGGSKGRTG